MGSASKHPSMNGQSTKWGLGLSDSFGSANAIIWGVYRRFAEPINSAHLPRAHADRHGNRVVP